MARNPSASESHPGGGSVGQQGGRGQPDNSTAPGRDEGGGAMPDDPALEGSADPWAETDAGHPDESSSDSLDHPQPEDEATPNPGT
ncbi:MAG TPA: hypothetical protein VEX11_00195 [Acetobacteraceae bacterium]|nr:hypothetical protein [Acetobacteraceae bacterium]